jgi:twinkle protein
MTNVVEFEEIHRHAQRGYFSLQSLQQSGPVSDIAMGTGWWELDQIWRLYPGQFTIVTGIPGHGKSTFLLNVLANLAREKGTRSFLYVPENESHLRDKMREIWGSKPGFEKFCESQCFVQSAMPDKFNDEPQDLSWVLNRAVVAIEKDMVDVLLIDPWNELEHAKPNNMPMTDYIRLCLMYLKQFSRAHRVAVILVAHPTKAVAEHGGRVPTLADIEGSMSWYNKCDNGLIIVRDFDTKTSKVISAKVRERGAGKIGACHFHVDENTGRFTPQYGAVTP